MNATDKSSPVINRSDENSNLQFAIELPEKPVVIIEPRRNSLKLNDLWQYRELFAILAWRDVSVQYKQTIIGAAWAIIRPGLTMAIFISLPSAMGGVANERMDAEDVADC